MCKFIISSSRRPSTKHGVKVKSKQRYARGYTVLIKKYKRSSAEKNHDYEHSVGIINDVYRDYVVVQLYKALSGRGYAEIPTLQYYAEVPVLKRDLIILSNKFE